MFVTMTGAMNTASLNGATIAFDDVGDGDAVVLIHGHPFDRSMWRPQITALSQAGFRAIAPDLRGYGESHAASTTAVWEQFARDIEALLDHLRIERAAIVGLSMGGQIAMESCRLFPQRVRALILVATFSRPETDQGKVDRYTMADRLVREGMQGYADEVLPKMVAPKNIAALPDVAGHVLRMMLNTPPEGAAAALRGRAGRPDYAPTLAAFDKPALIVVGDEDAFTSRADADTMHRLLRHSELTWIDDAGHMPNLERDAQFNEALLRFLRRLG
jgi:3-oxoadipate enol-lactonase